MDNLIRDLRFAGRALGRAPGFTIVVVLTLAIGVGAASAIFSLVDGILLKPLAFPQEERLVVLWHDWRGRGGPEREWFSYQNYADIRDEEGLFEEAGIYGDWFATLTSTDEPERVAGARVSEGMLSRVLQVQPALGRGFRPEEDEPGAPGTVMLTHGFWTRAFGQDPTVIGRSLLFDGEPYEVAGVLPQGFTFPMLNGPELFTLTQLNRDPEVSGGRGSIYLRVIARLAPGVSLEEGASRLNAVGARLAAEYPEVNGGAEIVTYSLRSEVTGDSRIPLLTVLGAVGFLLLITCINVANLLLGRGTTRSSEMAVRTALGANRGRIVRQLLTESLVLAVVGGGLGVLVALWGTDLLVGLAPEGTPRLDEVGLDLRVLAFSLALTLGAGTLFGVGPAIQAARSTPAAALRGSRGAGPDGRASSLWVRRGLVVGQVALALTLLIGSGLFARSIRALNDTDLGYEPEGVLTVQVSLPSARYAEPEDRSRFYLDLVERVEAIPGVTAGGAVSGLPLAGLDGDSNFRVEGRPRREVDRENVAWTRAITDNYLAAMGIEVVQGRSFNPGDDRGAPRVVLVNQALADLHFPAGDAVGGRIGFGPEDDPGWREIVGVVENTRHFSVDEPRTQPATYFPHLQVTRSAMGLAIRSTGDPLDLAGAVRAAVSEMDSELAVSSVQPLAETVREALAPRRLVTILLTVFSAIALFLAALGIYGVLSFMVTRRAHEMGVRLALGASPGQVSGLVFKGGLTLAAAGTLLGVGASLLLAQFVDALLFGVASTDPTTFATMAGVLLVVAGLASYVPARRALRLDPAQVLTTE
jgi:predicted permease